MNIVRTEKNDQVHIKSWVMKLSFLCVGPGCCLCNLRYLKCATASFQRSFLHSGTTIHKAPPHSDPAGYKGKPLVSPRVRFKGTPPTSAKAMFTRIWPFLKRHSFSGFMWTKCVTHLFLVSSRNAPHHKRALLDDSNRLVWTRIVFSKEANVEQSKGNRFYVTSFMYYNRPWATTNHSALSFHIIV